jgi:hypothetical protein
MQMRGWSEGVVKRGVWLSGLVPFERAAEILAKIGQVDMSDSTLWRQVQAWGEGFRQQAEAEWERAQVRGRPSGKRRAGADQKQRLGLAMDGSVIHIRGEGWKEVKEGCVFEIEQRPALDEATGDMVELAHAIENSYVAYLGGPEHFGELLWAEAQRRNWDQAGGTQVLGDGAPWIWNLTATHFYRSRQTVDWYHALEHLAAANRVLHEDGSLAHRRFYQTWKKTLFQGHALQLAEKLQIMAESRPAVADDLRREAGYFANNQRRMNYLDLRSEGWLIGSGMIESGCKQTKARLAGSGMRWSRTGAERLLPVRTAIMSKRFDQIWESVYNLPPN